MANTILGSGQSISSMTLNDASIIVVAGGSIVDVTLQPSAVNVSSGGSATRTVLNGSGGFISNLAIYSGGTATGTIVNNGVFDLGGTEANTVVNSGGEYVQHSGTSVGVDFRPGSKDFIETGVLQSATIERGAMFYDLLPSAMLIDPVVQPGAAIDFEDIPAAAGGTASLDTMTNTLTVSEGATISRLHLAGNYAGETVVARNDGGIGETTYQAGTLVTFLNNVPAGTAIDASLAGAQQFASYAVYDAQVALQVARPQGSVVSGAIDPAGNLAILSTPDGAGHTLIASGTGQSIIAAGGGADTVTVSNGADLIATGIGANSVYLVTGSNTIYSEGTDHLFVGAGSDTATISGKTVITAGNASLNVFLQPTAQLTLSTGAGSVQVQGGYGSGTFSGGTNGNNLLVAGTGATTLYAGGNNDVLVASGGSGTTMYGWSGNETMVGQYSQGTDTFNFGAANVFATAGLGQNIFNIGTGNNAIVALQGASLFNVTNGSAGGNTYIANYNASVDHIHLAGYAPDEVANALGTATTYQGSEILHLRDGTSLSFGGVTGLTQASFV